jgi:hypothetical protein
VYSITQIRIFTADFVKTTFILVVVFRRSFRGKWLLTPKLFVAAAAVFAVVCPPLLANCMSLLSTIFKLSMKTPYSLTFAPSKQISLWKREMTFSSRILAANSLMLKGFFLTHLLFCFASPLSPRTSLNGSATALPPAFPGRPATTPWCTDGPQATPSQQ